MKSKVAAALALAALLLTGCGSSDQPSTTPSANAAVTLTQWVSDLGVTTQLTAVVDELNGLLADLQSATTGDNATLGKAYAARAEKLDTVAKAISAMPASDDAEFETLRGNVSSSVAAFVTAAQAVSAAATANTDLSPTMNQATAAIPPISAAIKALTDYIGAHGGDTLHAAS